MICLKKGVIDTKDLILNSAIDLFAEKGFRNTTIKEIAAGASVTEMTVFRYFETKDRILKEAIDRFSFEIPMKSILKDKLIYDLEADLRLIGETYHKFIKLNEKVLLVKLKENKYLLDNAIDAVQSPRHFVEFLVRYFNEMYKLGKIINTDFETQAVTFLWMHFGFLCSTIVVDNKLTNITLEDFIKNSIKIFTKVLRPQNCSG